jgi:DNA polymerase-3 subunit epsilon
MNFTAIDFETANPARSSACSVGLIVVQDGKVVERFYSLIKPPTDDFSPFNVRRHRGAMDALLHEPPRLPFSLDHIPTSFPPPDQLSLWITERL